MFLKLYLNNCNKAVEKLEEAAQTLKKELKTKATLRLSFLEPALQEMTVAAKNISEVSNAFETFSLEKPKFPNDCFIKNLLCFYSEGYKIITSNRIFLYEPEEDQMKYAKKKVEYMQNLALRHYNLQMAALHFIQLAGYEQLSKETKSIVFRYIQLKSYFNGEKSSISPYTPWDDDSAFEELDNMTYKKHIDSSSAKKDIKELGELIKKYQESTEARKENIDPNVEAETSSTASATAPVTQAEKKKNKNKKKKNAQKQKKQQLNPKPNPQKAPKIEEVEENDAPEGAQNGMQNDVQNGTIEDTRNDAPESTPAEAAPSLATAEIITPEEQAEDHAEPIVATQASSLNQMQETELKEEEIADKSPVNDTENVSAPQSEVLSGEQDSLKGLDSEDVLHKLADLGLEEPQSLNTRVNHSNDKTLEEWKPVTRKNAKGEEEILIEDAEIDHKSYRQFGNEYEIYLTRAEIEKRAQYVQHNIEIANLLDPKVKNVQVKKLVDLWDAYFQIKKTAKVGKQPIGHHTGSHFTLNTFPEKRSYKAFKKGKDGYGKDTKKLISVPFRKEFWNAYLMHQKLTAKN